MADKRSVKFINHLITNEYRAAQKLDHNNLLTPTDYTSEATMLRRVEGSDEMNESKVAFFVYSYVPIANIQDFVEMQGGLDEWVCRYYFMQLLSAIRVCH